MFVHLSGGSDGASHHQIFHERLDSIDSIAVPPSITAATAEKNGVFTTSDAAMPFQAGFDQSIQHSVKESSSNAVTTNPNYLRIKFTSHEAKCRMSIFL